MSTAYSKYYESKLSDTNTKRVLVVNQTKKNQVSDDEVLKALKVMQKNYNTNLAKYWGLRIKLYYSPLKNKTIPTNMWHALLLDTSDEAGALGYHDVNVQDLPQCKTFVTTALLNRADWRITLDHEILEMRANPYGMKVFFNWVTYSNGTVMKRLVPNEICDPIEADRYGYFLDGTKVSNFVTPEYYDPFTDVSDLDEHTRYDMNGYITEAFEVEKGCHQSSYYMTGAHKDTWHSQTFRQAMKEHNPNEAIKEAIKNFDDIKGKIINIPQEYGWSVDFRIPDDNTLDKYKVDKEEVAEAMDNAFHPHEGSRRKILYKVQHALAADLNPLDILVTSKGHPEPNRHGIIDVDTGLTL